MLWEVKADCLKPKRPIINKTVRYREFADEKMENAGIVNMNICYGCMKPLNTGYEICPLCGYDNGIRQNGNDMLPEGTVLKGRYLIGRMIGRGGFGVTYLGLDLTDNMRLAIKEYFPVDVGIRDMRTLDVVSKSGDPSDFDYGRKSFYNEAVALSHFNSPNIVHVRAYFQEHGTAYIVMDFIEGVGLTELISRNGGRLPWQRILELMQPVMLALHTVHETNLIHRDIKPDNMIVVDEGGSREHVVLLDFGSARSYAANQSKRFTAVITPGYAPIEQYSQMARQGPYTDIYSLSGTIYACITGSKPPAATERLERGTEIKSFREFGISVPDYLEAALFHGMSLRSNLRPQSIQEFYAEVYPGHIDPSWKQMSYESAKMYMMERTQDGYQKAYDILVRLPGYRSADELAKLCREKLGITSISLDLSQKYNEIYNAALESASADNYPGYMNAVRNLKRIPRWRDADELAERYGNIIESRNRDYEQANEYLKKDDLYSLREARSLLENLHGWHDADVLLNECNKKIEQINSAYRSRDRDYNLARQYLDKDDMYFLEEARKLLENLRGWLDSDALLDECNKKIEQKKLLSGDTIIDNSGDYPVGLGQNTKSPGKSGRGHEDPPKPKSKVWIFFLTAAIVIIAFLLYYFVFRNS